METIFLAALKEETPKLSKFYHTGVGKINASIKLMELINIYKPTQIIKRNMIIIYINYWLILIIKWWYMHYLSPLLMLLFFIKSKTSSKSGIAGAHPTLVTTIAAAADPISIAF